MEVNLSADVQAKLTRIAQERGTDAQALAREAIERMVGYDEWFVREVEKGLAQVERGDTLSHEEVGAAQQGLQAELHVLDVTPFRDDVVSLGIQPFWTTDNPGFRDAEGCHKEVAQGHVHGSEAAARLRTRGSVRGL